MNERPFDNKSKWVVVVVCVPVRKDSSCDSCQASCYVYKLFFCIALPPMFLMRLFLLFRKWFQHIPFKVDVFCCFYTEQLDSGLCTREHTHTQFLLLLMMIMSLIIPGVSFWPTVSLVPSTGIFSLNHAPPSWLNALLIRVSSVY